METGDKCADLPDLVIGQCSVCELIQAVSFSHVNLAYYADANYYGGVPEKERERQWHWNRKRVARLKALLPAAVDRKVLDYGCGTGGFLEQAHGAFLEVAGFDVNESICSLHNALGWKCFSSIADVPGDVDVITLFHVLEHLPKPWLLLTDLMNRFPMAETFVIEVPNTQEALNSVFKNRAYRQNHFSSEHVYYFTSKTLRLIVEFAGLEVLVDSQLQRYTLGNNLGWLINNRGGGQDQWDFFNDEQLNEHYEQALISQGAADSVFMVCGRRSPTGQ